MEHEVIDNFLEESQFKKLQDGVLDVTFPWFVYSGVTEVNHSYDGTLTTALDKAYHWAFFHLFYQNFQPNSPKFDDLHDFIKKLELHSILRIKANLYPRTTEVVEHNFHLDYPYPHKAALLSLNTNNGYTMLEDGEKIESVANRVVFFDASKQHKSTTCSDENFRANIIINYL